MSKSADSLSRELARFVVNTRWTDLDRDTVMMAKASFLDWLGSCIAGAGQPAGMMLKELADDLGGRPQATVIADGSRNSVTNAALVNGGCSHIVELDDVHKASIFHPAAPIIPAALAMAEMVGADGRDVLLAMVMGYEVGIRIGEAVTPAHYQYWHTTATVGHYGAAAAAGKILGLTEDEMVHALGTAGTMASGLWEFLADGAMSKHLHPGKAAAGGVTAAMLAKKGFTGASRILEGDRGFFKAAAGQYDAGKVTAGLGQGYKINENCFKIHASCRHTHHAMDLILDLVRENDIQPAEIKGIRVGTYQIALNITGNHSPHTLYAAKFSLPFCVALSAVYRKAGLHQFSPEALGDQRVLDLMGKVELAVDQDLEARYPEQWPARVTIVTDRGNFSGETSYPKGDPENPVSVADLEQKFLELAEPFVGSRARQMADGVMALDGDGSLDRLIHNFTS